MFDKTELTIIKISLKEQQVKLLECTKKESHFNTKVEIQKCFDSIEKIIKKVEDILNENN